MDAGDSDRGRHEFGEEVLNAYVDGRLNEADRVRVEAYLARNPEAAARTEAYARLNRDLRRLFNNSLSDPLRPEHAQLGNSLERELARTQRRRHLRHLAAAAAVFLVFAGVLALTWKQTDGVKATNQLFALFESTTSGPNEQSRASTDGEPAVSDKALNVATPAAGKNTNDGSGESGGGQAAPDLSEFGFGLVGTRVLAKPDGNSMQLIYESEAGARVELFFSASESSQQTSLTLMEQGPVSVMLWRNGGRAYSLIGEVGRDTLLSMGKVINGEWTVSIGGPTSGRSDGDGDNGSASEAKAEGKDKSEGTDPEGDAGGNPDGNSQNGTVPEENLSDENAKSQKET